MADEAERTVIISLYYGEEEVTFVPIMRFYANN